MKPPTLTFERVRRTDGRADRIMLGRDEIHVWGFQLDHDQNDMPDVLSREEQDRASRFVSIRHKGEFVAARTTLRAVLSRYCGCPPGALVLRTTASGKPFLDAPGSSSERITFNLSHSRGRAVIAIAKDKEVGVDLEQIRPDIEAARLARRFLSQKDRSWIESGENGLQPERFLQVWVALEAVFKADGTGVRFPLYRYHVEFKIDGQYGRVVSEGGGQAPGCSFRLLSLEPGWVGAVAAAGTDWRVVLC
jgi:4'-phosphopantetheinyl transferase